MKVKAIICTILILNIFSFYRGSGAPVHLKPAFNFRPYNQSYYTLLRAYRELSHSEWPLPGNVPSLKLHDSSKPVIKIKEYMASTEKRLWVIDMDSRKILFNDLVAHGRNSGNNYAGRFSDAPGSGMSSLGFYILS